MERFGELIKRLRIENELPLRKVAAHLDIDQSTLSKIERGERFANRQNVIGLAEIFSIDQGDLMIALLSDKIANELLFENNSSDILKAAGNKIKIIRANSRHQGKLNL